MRGSMLKKGDVLDISISALIKSGPCTLIASDGDHDVELVESPFGTPDKLFI